MEHFTWSRIPRCYYLSCMQSSIEGSFKIHVNVYIYYETRSGVIRSVVFQYITANIHQGQKTKVVWLSDFKSVFTGLKECDGAWNRHTCLNLDTVRRLWWCVYYYLNIYFKDLSSRTYSNSFTFVILHIPYRFKF